ncbi:MAG: hypothetical protein WC879_03420 [Melioribacteraceae bacterium]
MIQETKIFLNTNDFAEPFTVTPVGGSASTINGLWRTENSPQQIGDVTVINDAPQVEFAAADSLTLVRKSIVVRTGTNETFYVIDAGLDVDGFTIKTLSRQIPV